MKKTIFLFLLLFKSATVMSMQQEGPIQNLPDETLYKIALDIIIPQMAKAQNLAELDKIRKNALASFALTNSRYHAIEKDTTLQAKIQQFYDDKKNEIINKLKTLQAMLDKNNMDFNIVKNGINTQNSVGYTPLMVAVQGNNIDIANLLISNGADVNVQSKYGDTPLMLAASKNNIDLVKLLISNGADVNVQDTIGHTPLMLAAAKNNFELVKLLLSTGANVNFQNKYGDTLLMTATKLLNNIYLVKLLISNGANINAQNEDGNTALIFAANNKNTEIINFLIEHGADAKIKNKKGKTAEDIINEQQEKRGKKRTETETPRTTTLSNDFTILGLNQGASREEITKAYKKLALKWHPDKWTPELGVPREEALEKFKVISNAYKKLTSQ